MNRVIEERIKTAHVRMLETPDYLMQCGYTSVVIPTNKGVRHGCLKSPTIFNIYIDDSLKKWESIFKTGMKPSATTLYILMYTDDITLFAESEQER